jgi:uncharacterized protein (DUF1501 family)
MLQFESKKGVELCNGLTRRDFLRVGALGAGAVGLSLADLGQLQQAGAASKKDINCIILFLLGGPSQVDTWDLKPDAPDSIRGPFQPIRTNVPGMVIGEHFPLMARMADQYALVRSMHHNAAPIHETGHQLMQTGRLSHAGQEYPHYGSVISYVKGRTHEESPAFWLLPGPIGHTGVSVGHGQTAGFLGAEHEPYSCTATDVLLLNGLADGVEETQRFLDRSRNLHEPFAQACEQIFGAKSRGGFDLRREIESLRDRYGQNTFGQSCLLARRLVETGVRLVTVNMFDTVFNATTWDCHADGGSLATTLDDYKQTLCPMFDCAYSTLLQDLGQRGLLENTLVVAMGEFGRTPQLNPRGGRDHWPGCWTVLFAGGGVRGGQVVGASDRTGSEPKDRPVTPEEVAATIYRALGIDLSTRLPGPEGELIPLVEAQPILELFGS